MCEDSIQEYSGSFRYVEVCLINAWQTSGHRWPISQLKLGECLGNSCQLNHSKNLATFFQGRFKGPCCGDQTVFTSGDE